MTGSREGSHLSPESRVFGLRKKNDDLLPPYWLCFVTDIWYCSLNAVETSARKY
jgi:hypothetical protein